MNEQFITQLRTIGTKVGMRIQVMNTVQKRPIRPGKRIHHSSWNIATLNINSLNSKIIMLLSFIQQNDLDFIALQETQRTTKSKILTIPRYSVIESTPDKLEKGVRGRLSQSKPFSNQLYLRIQHPTSYGFNLSISTIVQSYAMSMSQLIMLQGESRYWRSWRRRYSIVSNIIPKTHSSYLVTLT